MSTKTYSSFSTKATPQSESIPGKNMTQNNAGGFSFSLDKWGQFNRFLILGSEGGTYYVSEKKLTKDNALNVIACIAEDGERAVKEIVRVSDEGLAPKNDPAIFALALAASAERVETRQLALAALPKVCRIPTHLYHFNEYCKGLRGWGSSLKKANQRWFNDQDVDKLAYQLVKYQQRDGWSARDVLRKAHPKTNDAARNSLYSWVVDGLLPFNADEFEKQDSLPKIVAAFESAKTASKGHLYDLVRQYNLSREMLPTEALNDALVWEALLEKMPYTAMLRNLGVMSKVGLLKPLSKASSLVAERLVDEQQIKKARIHPIQILLALRTYASGHGLKGSNTWTVVPKVVDALDEAFYLAFKFVEPTGKNFLIGVDVSGSMGSPCAGTPLSCAEGAAAMALSIAKIEPNVYIHGFTAGGYGYAHDQEKALKGFVDLGITPAMRLDAALKRTRGLNFGATDCSIPMLYAIKEKLDVDCFITITDNETWAGKNHPTQALKQYRQKSGINARNIVIGMTATEFTVNDPSDQFGLDVCGFSAEVPTLIQGFMRD
ncbi:MAG: TROVE domain-containing protein [Candidatus Altimarinota bacterium]